MKHGIVKIIIKSDQKQVAITHADNQANTNEKDEQGIDVIVELQDGSKHVASFFLFDKLGNDGRTSNSEHSRNIDKYFWHKNMIMVVDFRSETIEQIIDQMMDEGDFEEAFEKIFIVPSLTSN